MSSTTRTRQKRTAVEHLSFNARTAHRVAWESWEFTIAGPHQVKVTNASYGYLKDEHAYVVGVEERMGVVVPAECECPADIHHESDCKHKVALATVGGPTVLNAAVTYENLAPATDDRKPMTTAADKIAAGGGVPAVAKQDEDDGDECEECANLSGLPCFACYRAGKATLDGERR